MDLPNAIRKMTSFPAQRLGLPDRGLLRDGFKADIVVFDAQRIKAPATRTQPKQFPIGIEYVVVNGKVVVDKGQHTGVMAGRALRRVRPPRPRASRDRAGPAGRHRARIGRQHRRPRSSSYRHPPHRRSDPQARLPQDPPRATVVLHAGWRWAAVEG